MHIGLLVAFVAWSRQGGTGFSIPGGSKVLVAIAVGLLVAGIVVATRRGILDTCAIGSGSCGWRLSGDGKHIDTVGALSGGLPDRHWSTPTLVVEHRV